MNSDRPKSGNIASVGTSIYRMAVIAMLAVIALQIYGLRQEGVWLGVRGPQTSFGHGTVRRVLENAGREQAIHDVVRERGGITDIDGKSSENDERFMELLDQKSREFEQRRTDGRFPSNLDRLDQQIRDAEKANPPKR